MRRDISPAPQQATYISLGTIAHKQGRVAGENAVGGDRQFAGAIGTQSLKVFDLAIARTGLLDHEARAGGFDPLTVPIQANDHKAYYPGAVPLNVLMSGDRSTGRLLGAQIVGSRKAEISKRIDIVAAALFQNAAVDELNEMDLSYTPPFSSPWNPSRWLPRHGLPRRALYATFGRVLGVRFVPSA